MINIMNINCRHLVLGGLLHILCFENVVLTVGDNSSKIDVTNSSETLVNDTLSHIELYKKLFQHRRKEQKEAVNSIMTFKEKYEKQYKMVKLLTDKIFQNLQDSRVILMESGYAPGDKFPETESLREAFSKVVENTAFFGDLVLHIPEISHRILKKNYEWELNVRWAVGFCNETQVFTGSHLKLLNLMAQELNIIERHPDYVNPYLQENDKLTNTDVFEKKEKDSTKKKGKKKKDKARGPRLSNAHTEL